VGVAPTPPASPTTGVSRKTRHRRKILSKKTGLTDRNQSQLERTLVDRNDSHNIPVRFSKSDIIGLAKIFKF
jgi:hypothetical protein